MSMEPVATHTALSQKVVAGMSDTRAEEVDCQFAERVSRACQRADCTFLFELPGELLSRPETRIAVIQCDGSGSNDGFLLIQEKGEVETLAPHDVPQEVRDFVASYRQVLTCLSEVKSCSRIGTH